MVAHGDGGGGGGDRSGPGGGSDQAIGYEEERSSESGGMSGSVETMGCGPVPASRMRDACSCSSHMGPRWQWESWRE